MYLLYTGLVWSVKTGLTCLEHLQPPAFLLEAGGVGSIMNNVQEGDSTTSNIAMHNNYNSVGCTVYQYQVYRVQHCGSYKFVQFKTLYRL